MRQVFRPLHRLRLSIQPWSDDENTDKERILLDDAAETLDTGVLNDLLTDTTDSRTPKLHMPMDLALTGLTLTVTKLQDVVGDIT